MRWVQFVILAYLVLVVQSTLCGMIAFDVGAVGRVMPDMMAATAVFVALRGPNLRAVMIAAWVLGFAVDLTAIDGVGSATAMGATAPEQGLGEIEPEGSRRVKSARGKGRAGRGHSAFPRRPARRPACGGKAR